MASLALETGDLFSIVTTGGRGIRKSLLDWPRLGATHVDYAADTATQRNLWAVRLDEAVRRADKPVLLVADGESCFAAAWWARLSPASYVARVAGALLFAPQERGDPARFASPRGSLPFPSTIIDGRARLDRRTLALAEGWGSDLLERGWEAPGDARGWQQAQALLTRLTAQIVERRMRVADALGVSLTG
jgi:predicted alpha/beta hydrolase family esterase